MSSARARRGKKTLVGVSRTSVYVAAGRAIGAREPDPAARNPDDLAGKLLGDPTAYGVEHPVVLAARLEYDEAMREVEVVSVVRAMTVRTRFIDEAAARAIAGGATQVVILGAGFDSRAHRLRELLAPVRVFEVDRPEMQAFKKERANDVLGGPPANLTYVPVDFRREDLSAALRRHGHDPDQRTFFIMEGVTMYVPEDEVRATLRFVASHPSGSGAVFDFVYRAMIDAIARIDLATAPEAFKPFLTRFLDLIRDEPWVCGLPVGGERAFLAEVGLEAREILMVGGEESLKRYLTRADGTQVGAEATAAAMARMAQQAASGQMPQMSPEQVQEQQRLMAYHLAEAAVP